MSDAAATILWASQQGFAKVLIVGEMPSGETKIAHDADLATILATLDKARAHLDFLIERTKHSRS
jgi:hypothetical protein